MERKILKSLAAWKNKRRRKPLLLSGARQTGKTYSVEAFAAAEYETCLKINFEKDDRVHTVFEDTLDPHVVIARLETYYAKRILPEKTLLFFDEIQACPRALTSLKYFMEDAGEYHVAGAGSLLGVALRRLDRKNGQKAVSFPVGKVDELKMYPMDFEEFLFASGHEKLAGMIRECFESNAPLATLLHEQALELFRSYLVTGGMPESVQTYLESGSYLEATEIVGTIYDDYLKDMAKYCTAQEALKNRGCYESVVAQLAKENKNFKYANVTEGKNAEYFGNSIEWLTGAGITLRSRLSETPGTPLTSHLHGHLFRLYLSDVGLFRHKANMAVSRVLDASYRDDLTGILTENYVACELTAAGIPLCYWKGKRQAEIEFLAEHLSEVIPIEVKSGKRVTSKSLDAYRTHYRVPYVYRVSTKNFGFENGIRAVPLYAVFCMAEELRDSKR